MKINEETTVSEEQVLFNKLRYEDQKLIINIMKTLQPCELSCEVEEEKKIPEKLESYISCGWNGTCKDLKREELFEDLKKIGSKINEIIDFLKQN